MRDIVITLFVAGLLPLIIRRPEIGAYAWVWISMMNPHKLAYGFAYSLPFAQAIAITTLIGFLFTRRRHNLPLNGGVVLLFLLILWMTLTSFFAINDSQLVWDRWLFVIKIHAMLFLTLLLLRERKQIDRLVWVVVVSIGFYGVKGGIYTILKGGSGRVWGPPGGMLEENNALAVALVLILPLMYYLCHTATRKVVRWGLVAAMVITAFSILGSQSRGALLALSAMAIALGFKSKRPARFLLILVVIAPLAFVFMPDSWTQRMDTIQSYSDDASAMSRLYTWNTLWNVAVARPLIGAGFAADNQMVFSMFAPTDTRFDVFQGTVWVAHSIYLQALGEHGFPGLFLFLAIWCWVWWAAGRAAKATDKIPELKDWAPLLMRMCQVSTLGFCVGGSFLSLMNLDVPYYLLAIVTLTLCAIKRESKSRRVARNELNLGMYSAPPPEFDTKSRILPKFRPVTQWNQ